MRLFVFCASALLFSPTVFSIPPESLGGGVGWDGGGIANHVLVVKMKAVNRFELVTISSATKMSPWCARSKNTLVLDKAQDMETAKRALQAHEFVTVFGRGECNKVKKYETVYGIQPENPTGAVARGRWNSLDPHRSPLPVATCNSVTCATGK